MIQQLLSKIVKTRKQHTCFACGEKFEPGTLMQYQTCVYDGDIYSLYTCVTCQELMGEHHDYFYDDGENCFPEGCVIECMSQMNLKEKTPEKLLEKLNNIN